MLARHPPCHPYPAFNRRVQKLPITVADLVNASPLSTLDGAYIMGSQHTTAFVLDAETGRLIQTYFDFDGQLGALKAGGEGRGEGGEDSSGSDSNIEGDDAAAAAAAGADNEDVVVGGGLDWRLNRKGRGPARERKVESAAVVVGRKDYVLRSVHPKARGGRVCLRGGEDAVCLLRGHATRALEINGLSALSKAPSSYGW